MKVYRDGHDNGDLGSSSAQSVVLMAAIIVLTALQFRFLGRRPNEGRELARASVLVLGVLMFALPIWLILAGSTESADLINRGQISLSRAWTLPLIPKCFSKLLQLQPPVGHMLLVSAGMALTIAAGKIFISLLSAYAVVFFRFPFRMAAFWAIFITLMLPVEVRIVPTYLVMSRLHLIDSFAGLTVPLIASATATLLFRQVFLAIPDELVEAARMDGAGPLRFLKDVLIPVTATNIAALFVILFVYGWNQYLWPLLVAADPRLDTIIVGIVRMIGVESLTEWNKVMAVAALALVPPVAVVLLMQRWFVKGLTEGEK